MKKENWVWMPHPGHLCVSDKCRFHLNTYVGGYIVSTVGEYVPDYRVQEVLASSRGVSMKFEKIGIDHTYETMVFRATASDDACCPFGAANYTEIDMEGYNSAGAAYAGHLKMCAKWARRK